MATVKLTFERVGRHYDAGVLELPRERVTTEYGHQLDWEALEEVATNFAAALLIEDRVAVSACVADVHGVLAGNIILGGIRDGGYFTIEECA